LSTSQAVLLKYLARDAGVRNRTVVISIYALLDAELEKMKVIQIKLRNPAEIGKS
jgi:hypothetical protein